MGLRVSWRADGGWFQHQCLWECNDWVDTWVLRRKQSWEYPRKEDSGKSWYKAKHTNKQKYRDEKVVWCFEPEMKKSKMATLWGIRARNVDSDWFIKAWKHGKSLDFIVVLMVKCHHVLSRRILLHFITFKWILWMFYRDWVHEMSMEQNFELMTEAGAGRSGHGWNTSWGDNGT